MDETYRQALAEGCRAGSRTAMVSPRRTPAGVLGTQLGRRPGSSIEFMEHREYQRGDDVRRVDWSAYARTRRLIVKLHREEVSPHADIILDGSGSMALPGTRKAEGTLALAAALATAARNAQMTHDAWLLRDRIEPIPGGRQAPQAWVGIDFSSARSPVEVVMSSPAGFRRQGVRLLLSDLLFPGDPLPMLTRLGGGAAALVVVQVLARQDIEPPARGNLRLTDSETGAARDLFIDAAAQQRYRQRFSDHRATWEAACRRTGATLLPLIAEDVLETWDLRTLMIHDVLEPA